MFVQIIKAHISDHGLGGEIGRWRESTHSSAVGFLGATAGIADDGTTVMVVRFEDEAAARASAPRPEQSVWWESAVKHCDVAPIVLESSDVELVFDGGSDAAGFVQVIEGVVKDRRRMTELASPELLAQLRDARPDIIGGIRVWFPGDAFVEVAYFTTETDAREGETSAEFADAHDEIASLYDPTAFIDIREPIFITPPDLRN